ncbi:MAG: hypothetical protein AB1427_13500 [Thermodesulfobacteriota bacterium]
MDTKLLWICVSSFTGVFAVLTFLAVTMHVITLIFPVRKLTAKAAGSDDAVVYAAITSTYARLYPGTKVSNIEEIK